MPKLRLLVWSGKATLCLPGKQRSPSCSHQPCLTLANHGHYSHHEFSQVPAPLTPGRGDPCPEHQNRWGVRHRQRLPNPCKCQLWGIFSLDPSGKAAQESSSVGTAFLCPRRSRRCLGNHSGSHCFGGTCNPHTGIRRRDPGRLQHQAPASVPCAGPREMGPTAREPRKPGQKPQRPPWETMRLQAFKGV